MQGETAHKKALMKEKLKKESHILRVKEPWKTTVLILRVGVGEVQIDG